MWKKQNRMVREDLPSDVWPKGIYPRAEYNARKELVGRCIFLSGAPRSPINHRSMYPTHSGVAFDIPITRKVILILMGHSVLTSGHGILAWGRVEMTRIKSRGISCLTPNVTHLESQVRRPRRGGQGQLRKWKLSSHVLCVFIPIG